MFNGTLTGFVEILHVYGGWAVSVFLGIAIIKFYKDHKKIIFSKDTLIEKMNKEHHEEMVSVVRECTGVLTTVSESIERWEREMGELRNEWRR